MTRRLIFALLLPLLLAAPLALAQQARQARPSRPGHTAPDFPDQVFATVGGKPLKLDIYLPKTPSATPRPLVINIHGGGWSMGGKEGCPSYVWRMTQLGFAVASVQYRLTSQAGKWGAAPVTFPAQIHDVKGAVRYLRANAKKYNLDQDRFAAWGGSAGGHLAALLATSGGVKELEGDVGGNLDQSSKVQAAVDYFGPTDMLHIYDDIVADHLPAPDFSPNNPIARLVGLQVPAGQQANAQRLLTDSTPPYVAARRLLTQANPITFIDAGDPPLFIGHATGDWLVPISQSKRLDEAMKKAGARSQLKVTQGGGHGNLSLETHVAAVRFLCETLNPSAVKTLDAVIQQIQKQPRPKAAPIGRLLRLLR
jgi:acetyl esterase/lipase